MWRERNWRGKIPRERERVCVEGERAVREERESAESEREIPVCVGFCGELRGA